ncbi:MAG: Na(+)-translocating NADH-quinone reductase subunit C [Phocaeicola sp.]
MNTNSNSYTILYASVMVIIVAFLLAFVSSSLKDTQNANVELDGKKQILAALNVRKSADAAADYSKFVQQDMLMQADGSLVAYEGAFQSSYKGEMDENRFHVFVCQVEGATKYVLPIYGAGLWGPIWGYVALNEDKATVYGAYFSHKSETPGLGADIATAKFQDQFVGKQVFDNSEVALTVVKNGKVVNGAYEVDGISGGTITSVGVANMLHDCLSVYTKFLTNK